MFLYVNILKQYLLFIFACLYFIKIRKSSFAIFAGDSIFRLVGSHWVTTIIRILSIAMIAINNLYLTILFKVPIFIYALFRTLILKPKISIKELESWLLSSIVYDLDWNVTLNGKRVDFHGVNGGFIGFNFPLGEFAIERHFLLRKIIYGFVISLVSILGYFLI